MTEFCHLKITYYYYSWKLFCKMMILKQWISIFEKNNKSLLLSITENSANLERIIHTSKYTNIYSADLHWQMYKINVIVKKDMASQGQIPWGHFLFAGILTLTSQTVTCPPCQDEEPGVLTIGDKFPGDESAAICTENVEQPGHYRRQ